jgi:hypothetical protein
LEILTMNSRPTRSLALPFALWLGIALGTTAHAQSSEAPGKPLPPLTRAEVIADLNLWQQAGLDQFSDPAVRDALDQAYQQALATYQALRQGPAYTAELARVRAQRGETPRPSATASADAPCCRASFVQELAPVQARQEVGQHLELAQRM